MFYQSLIDEINLIKTIHSNMKDMFSTLFKLLSSSFGEK